MAARVGRRDATLLRNLELVPVIRLQFVSSR